MGDVDGKAAFEDTGESTHVIGPTGARITTPVTLGGPEFLADPHAYYTWLRDEAPVHAGRLSAVTDRPIWLVSRYEDCRALLTDDRFLRAPEGRSAATDEMPEHLRLFTTDSLIYRDDPDHRRLRRLVAKPFTPRAIERLGERVHDIASQRLDELAGTDTVDLRQDYALPIPSTVIADMVGVDPADRSRFLTTMQAIFAGLGGVDDGDRDRQGRAAVELVRDLVAHRRAEPGDDILSGLIQAEEDGDRLSDDELVAMVFTLLLAGYETTYSLITNAVAALLDHPDTMVRLRDASDDDALWRSAIEEIVRWTGTVGGTEIITSATDVTWHGQTIPRGAMVVPVLAAANRDPRAFDDPDHLDIDRSDNHHVGFGHGVHFCLGANLARMETRTAVQVLLARCPGLQLAVDPSELILEPIPFMTRWDSLPVRLG